MKISIEAINEIVLDVIATEQSYVRKDATKDELLYLMGFNDGALEILNRLKVIKASEQEPILDKIRAEIEQTAKDYDKFDDYRRVHGLWIALDIIDKYKAESEDKE